MYRLFLSLRFLRHHWLMTLIGSFFVGASLVILVVVMSVMDGFQAKLKETLAGSSADVTITPRWACDPEKLSDALEKFVPEVIAAGPYYETITLVRRAGKIDPVREKMHYAVVFGIDPKRESRINRFQEYLSPTDDHGRRPHASVRDLDAPFEIYDKRVKQFGTVGVILGRGLAEEIGVFPGDMMRMAIAQPAKPDPKDPNSDPSDVSFQYRQMLVVGLYQSGNSDVDHSCVFMDHAQFTTLFDSETARASVRCKVDHPDAFDQEHMAQVFLPVRDKLIVASKLPDAVVDDWHRNLRGESWKEKNETLVQAIESEKAMILVIAFLIVVAGTSSIFAAQWLLVSDKIREIGILRALGANFSGVVSIFVLNGFLMGVLGAAGGAFGGLLVVRYIDYVHALISWLLGHKVFDPKIYLFEKIPTLVDYGEVARYAFAALACTLVASAIPAMRAGFMKPAEALHRD